MSGGADQPLKQKKRLKWEPPSLMVVVLIFGVWLVSALGTHPGLPEQRDGAVLAQAFAAACLPPPADAASPQRGAAPPPPPATPQPADVAREIARCTAFLESRSYTVVPAAF